jgi:hypothetical protein
VRDGPAKKSLRRAFWIDVDVLMIAGRVGEEVDSILGDFNPLAHSDFLADQPA